MCGIEDRFVLSGLKFLLKYKGSEPLPSPEGRGSQLRQPEAGGELSRGISVCGIGGGGPGVCSAFPREFLSAVSFACSSGNSALWKNKNQTPCESLVFEN